METMNNGHPWSDPAPAAQTPVRRIFSFATDGRELFFGLLTLICGMLMCNFVLFGGFELGFALAMCGYIICASGYLLASGGRLGFYSTLLLLLSTAIAAGFGTPVVEMDLTKADSAVTLGENDALMAVLPVYAGRVPQISLERLAALKGNGQKACLHCVQI